MGDAKMSLPSVDIVVTNTANVVIHHEGIVNTNHTNANGSVIPNSDTKRHKTVSFSDSETTCPKFVAKKWPQYVAALAAQISGLALGVSWFWSATAIPSMIESGEFGELSKSAKSWITSTAMLGALLFCPITGFFLNTYGRQRTLMWASLPQALGWFLISYSTSIPLILFGRIIVGGVCGLSGVIGPILISESVEAPIRGALMTMFELMISVGTLFIYITGSYFSWHIQSLACGFISLAAAVSIYFIPESPYFLMENNDEEGAVKALCWLRGASSKELIASEIEEVKQTVRLKNKSENDLGWRDAIKDRAVLRPILLSMALLTFFQFSYVNVILAATVEIFQSAGSFDEYYSTILIGIIQVIATCVPMLLADKFGRRILILISLFSIAGSLACLGCFFHLRIIHGELYIQNWTWIPLASLIVYIIACSIGIVPLSWVMTAEIAPPKAKGMSSIIIGIYNRIVGFLLMITFWDVIEAFGLDGTYWFIAAINLFAAVFMIFYLPETKGKTLEEIQSYFARSKKKKGNDNQQPA